MTTELKLATMGFVLLAATGALTFAGVQGVWWTVIPGSGAVCILAAFVVAASKGFR